MLERGAVCLQDVIEVHEAAGGRACAHSTRFLEHLLWHLPLLAFSGARKLGWMLLERTEHSSVCPPAAAHSSARRSAAHIRPPASTTATLWRRRSPMPACALPQWTAGVWTLCARLAASRSSHRRRVAAFPGRRSMSPMHLLRCRKRYCSVVLYNLLKGDNEYQTSTHF